MKQYLVTVHKTETKLVEAGSETEAETVAVSDPTGWTKTVAQIDVALVATDEPTEIFRAFESDEL